MPVEFPIRWRIATPCVLHQPSAAGACVAVGCTTKGKRWSTASSRIIYLSWSMIYGTIDKKSTDWFQPTKHWAE